MKKTLGSLVILGFLSAAAYGSTGFESVNFDSREDCVDQCWHDFFPAAETDAFQFSLDVDVETRLDEIVFVCIDSDGDEEKLEIEGHPGFLTSGTSWTSEEYGNPCPGRLNRIAVRGFKMFFNDDDPAIFTVTSFIR